jgi:hypothetical protein
MKIIITENLKPLLASPKERNDLYQSLLWRDLGRSGFDCK